jgi:hypothetical protein
MMNEFEPEAEMEMPYISSSKNAELSYEPIAFILTPC